MLFYFYSIPSLFLVYLFLNIIERVFWSLVLVVKIKHHPFNFINFALCTLTQIDYVVRRSWDLNLMDWISYCVVTMLLSGDMFHSLMSALLFTFIKMDLACYISLIIFHTYFSIFLLSMLPCPYAIDVSLINNICLDVVLNPDWN